VAPAGRARRNAAALNVRELPRALLFDLDDTIVRESAGGEALWAECCALVAGRAGVEAARLHTAIEESRVWFWSDGARSRGGRLALSAARRTIAERAFRALGLRELALAAELADTFTRERSARMRFFPGAAETLRHLRERGHRLALVTNGGAQPQREKIERFALAPFFDVILVEGELGFGKPDPRVFARALRALAADPDDAWMIGNDLDADIAGGCEAGLRTVWVDSEGQGLPNEAPARPDRVVAAIAELVAEPDPSSATS
jgi:putative hydrolase of the HAD superfamily